MKNTNKQTTETMENQKLLDKIFMGNQKLTDKEKYVLEMGNLFQHMIDGYREGYVKRYKLKRILREKGFTKDDYIVKEIKKIDKQLNKQKI